MTEHLEDGPSPEERVEKRWTLWVCPRCGVQTGNPTESTVISRGHWHDGRNHPPVEIAVVPEVALAERDAEIERLLGAVEAAERHAATLDHALGNEQARAEKAEAERDRALEYAKASQATLSQRDRELGKWLLSDEGMSAAVKALPPLFDYGGAPIYKVEVADAAVRAALATLSQQTGEAGTGSSADTGGDRHGGSAQAAEGSAFPVSAPPVSAASSAQEKCERCGGGGRINAGYSSEEDCPDCNGTGVQPPTQQPEPPEMAHLIDALVGVLGGRFVALPTSPVHLAQRPKLAEAAFAVMAIAGRSPTPEPSQPPTQEQEEADRG